MPQWMDAALRKEDATDYRDDAGRPQAGGEAPAARAARDGVTVSFFLEAVSSRESQQCRSSSSSGDRCLFVACVAVLASVAVLVCVFVLPFWLLLPFARAAQRPECQAPHASPAPGEQLPKPSSRNESGRACTNQKHIESVLGKVAYDFMCSGRCNILYEQRTDKAKGRYVGYSLGREKDPPFKIPSPH